MKQLRLRYILPAILLSTAIAPTAEAAEYRQAKTPLHLRTAPTAKATSVNVIPTGVYIKELGRLGDWSKVRYGAKTGYASSKYLLTEAQIGGKRFGSVLLVNKQYALKSTYAPGENVVARGEFERMKADAKKDGIHLVAFSTYRSYAYQKNLFAKYVEQDGIVKASTYSARAGRSEHQTGLAFDLGGKDSTLFAKAAFAKTKESKWLEQHAHAYGFHLRYPKGKEAETGYTYESWHYRYVGKAIASHLKLRDMTMEEYYKVVPTLH
ncbi:D-alanyl-D-alanine carboxypeptidase family protein [Exiguobacterium flavidum]|uniref:D-alanyl-D-alanine carboxypeptidase family protein n=1 Tax=Exiguobacterium flavidum TaxID=2184695 RepID=UPI000DF7C748|nr:D-alanyl-D-alanine carboxypeptidase family protein [Exiguobacterium flavidum]